MLQYRMENKVFYFLFIFIYFKVTILIPLFFLTPPIETTKPLYEIKREGGGNYVQ
jgi:hypothetical protein